MHAGIAIHTIFVLLFSIEHSSLDIILRDNAKQNNRLNAPIESKHHRFIKNYYHHHTKCLLKEQGFFEKNIYFIQINKSPQKITYMLYMRSIYTNSMQHVI